MMLQKREETVRLLLACAILGLLPCSLRAQYAGGTGTADDPFLIATAEQMNAIGLNRTHWNKHFQQIADIDLGAYTGEQFHRIGQYGGLNFTGTFDGNGFEIRNFTCQSTRDRIGMFEALGQPGELRNIVLIDPRIDCPQSVTVGALVAGLGEGIIRNCKILGGTIVADWGVGGFVGQTWAGSGTPINIIECHATAEVTGNRDVGGIIGSNFGRVHNCSSAGQVTGERNVGGLVGSNSHSAPWNTAKGEIVNSYSTCRVSGGANVGGLCGQSGAQTMITHCYAAGQVTGTSRIGGLLGEDMGTTVSDCFWDLDTSGQSVCAGGTGLSTLQMQDPATYRNAGWDTADIWIVRVADYPALQWESTSGYPPIPVPYPAEDAVIDGARVGCAAPEFRGVGYVSLQPEVANEIEWTVSASSPGTQTVCLRYINRTDQAVSAEVSVNGVVVCSEQSFPSTGAGGAWNTVGICAYLNHGNNAIRLTATPTSTGLHIDELTLLDGDTDLAFDSILIASGEHADHPGDRAIDANSTTCWIAQGYPQWIEVDMGLVHRINRTELLCPENRAYQYKVEAKLSAEDSYGLLIDRSENETIGKPVLPTVDAFEAMPARFVRLTVTGAHDYEGTEVKIAEFAVFGTAQTPAISIGPRGYATIQTALGAAGPDDVVVLCPGLYRTNLRMIEKAPRIAAVDPVNPAAARTTIIQGHPGEPVVTLEPVADETSLTGLTLTGGSYGIQSNRAPLHLRNCRITGNQGPGIELFACSAHLDHCLIAANGGAGVGMIKSTGRVKVDGTAEVTNCTIAQNVGPATTDGQLQATNCIFWLNGDGTAPQIQTENPALTHCTTEVDPLFVLLGAWADPDDSTSEWLAGDYHLQPTSPCIDAGNPGTPFDSEPLPNGGRVNLGIYGGTSEATTSR